MEPHPKDEWCQRRINRKPSADAKVWLADQRVARSIGGLGPSASVGFVSRLHGDGACRVVAIDIRTHRGRPGLGEASETAEGVVIELPGDRDARQRLFAREAEAAAEQGFDPTPDEGQNFLFLKVD
jgi:hypothetical protein